MINVIYHLFLLSLQIFSFKSRVDRDYNFSDLSDEYKVAFLGLESAFYVSAIYILKIFICVYSVCITIICSVSFLLEQMRS